jgi:hypothetical protein
VTAPSALRAVEENGERMRWGMTILSGELGLGGRCAVYGPSGGGVHLRAHK